MKYLLTGHESERLNFRLLEESDFDWWMEFAANKTAVRYFDFTDDLNPREFCRLWFDKVFERYKNDTGGHNVLVDKKTGEALGMCGLLIQDVDGISELEIGYSIHPKYWKRGFAAEAATECKKFAFKNGFADSLISIVHEDNTASMKVAKRNGMKVEKATVYKGIPVLIFRVYKPI